jgi:hypothetical protein
MRQAQQKSLKDSRIIPVCFLKDFAKSIADQNGRKSISRFFSVFHSSDYGRRSCIKQAEGFGNIATFPFAGAHGLAAGYI